MKRVSEKTPVRITREKSPLPYICLSSILTGKDLKVLRAYFFFILLNQRVGYVDYKKFQVKLELIMRKIKVIFEHFERKYIKNGSLELNHLWIC